MKFVMVAALLAVIAGCTDPNGARRVLEASGFTEIEIGGFGWFTCGNGDNFSTTFSAIGPSGKPVTGAVCRGVLKNSTIRID